MNSRGRSIVILVGLLTVIALLAACGPSPSPTEAPAEQVVKETVVVEREVEVTREVQVEREVEVTREVPVELESQELVVRVNLEGFSLDPARTTAGEDWTVMQQIYNALLRFKPGTFELEPDLATDWEVSPDGKEWTFQLREGVQFHRGFGELTAEDVKFSLERLKDPEISVYVSEVDVIDRVEVLSDYRLRISLKAAAPDFLYKVSTLRPFTGYVVSKKAVEEYGDDFGNNPIGTGPFMLKTKIPRDRWVLEPNPDYFEGPPKLSKVTVLVMPDEPTVALAVEAGEVHIAEAQSNETRMAYLDHPDVDIVPVNRIFGCWLVLNELVEPLDDVRVRRAIAYAIDYEEIVNELHGGFAIVPGAGMLHPGMFGYDPEVNQPMQHDIDEAKRLLAEAGYADGLKLTAVSYTTSIYRQLGELMQAQVREAGIDLEVQNLERATLVEARFKETTPAVFFASTDAPDPNPWLLFEHSDNIPPDGFDMARYSGMDDLISRATTEVDPETRKDLLREFQAKHSEDLPFIPLYHPQVTFLVHKSVKGYVPEAVGGTGSLHQVYLAAD
jgi:peptide/nickel transport system substrate-binding protein